MPGEGYKTITVSDEVRDKVGVMKAEHERELGVELSWDQFVQMLAIHWAKSHREPHQRRPKRKK